MVTESKSGECRQTALTAFDFKFKKNIIISIRGFTRRGKYNIFFVNDSKTSMKFNLKKIIMIDLSREEAYSGFISNNKLKFFEGEAV